MSQLSDLIANSCSDFNYDSEDIEYDCTELEDGNHDDDDDDDDDDDEDSTCDNDDDDYDDDDDDDDGDLHNIIVMDNGK